LFPAGNFFVPCGGVQSAGHGGRNPDGKNKRSHAQSEDNKAAGAGRLRTQTDKNFRLFRKSKARYIAGRKVHETLEVNGTIGELKNKLLHFSVSDYESYKKKMIHYGALKGQELAAKGKKYSFIIQYSKTVFKFFKAYILRLGILDGKEGYQLSFLQSLSVFETYESLKKEQK